MRTQPIRPAESAADAASGLPRSAESCQAALDDAGRIELAGNGLPGRWSGRVQFVVLDCRFGQGDKFLATWQAWRADAQRCDHLIYVALEGRPLRCGDLAAAHQQSPANAMANEMVATWPPLTPNLHTLDFEEGRVQLLLVLGDPTLLLPTVQVQADAIFLATDAAFQHGRSAFQVERWLKILGRKAAFGSTLAGRAERSEHGAACPTRPGLQAAGFELDAPASSFDRTMAIDAEGIQTPEDEVIYARWAPRFTARRLPTVHPASAPLSGARHAVVVGAGVAGAAAARALARNGWRVTVLDRHASPASEASGNPAGLFHGTVNPDDGPYSRLFRAAALQAQREYAPMLGRHGRTCGAANGLLRLDPQGLGVAHMQRLIESLGLPPEYVQALPAAQASALAGLRLRDDAWYYPGGGWLDPTQWVRHALDHAAIDLRCSQPVHQLQRTQDAGHPPGWELLGPTGEHVAAASTVILACAASSAHLLGDSLGTPWPLSATQGQVTYWAGDAQDGPGELRIPLAGDGYAIPLPQGGVLCGATRVEEPVTLEAPSPDPKAQAHHVNLQRLERLCGLQAPSEPQGRARGVRGRCGVRLNSADRLPIAGALPQREMPSGTRIDQARLLPRESGLFVLTALGARGLTLAPLLGRLVAAQASRTPWPLEQDLADAVDPARWLIRAARHAETAGIAETAGTTRTRTA